MLTDVDHELDTTEMQLNGNKWLQEHSTHDSRSAKRLTRSLKDKRLRNQNITAGSNEINQIVKISKLNQSGPFISLHYVGEKLQVRELPSLKLG